MIRAGRVPFVLLAMSCLLAGLWTGLTRIGWELYVTPAVAHHGAIMVGGFLGTLISLEKIIPLKKKWLFAVPVLSAGSALALGIGYQQTGLILLIAASCGLSGVFFFYLWRNRDLIYAVMSAGGLCWLAGNVFLFTERFYPLAFPWWLGFTLFVITAERVEISRFLPVTSKQKMVLVSGLLAFLGSAAFSFHGTGSMLMGISLAVVALWLMRYDLVGVTIRKKGLTQFVAIALLCGYFSLLLAGILSIAFKENALAYDAIVHTYFVGFVFSMIFAHGPIILPGVLGISVKPFHKLLFVWLSTLQLSWMLRLVADVLIEPSWRKISGLLGAVAIVFYFVTMAVLTIRARYAKTV